MFDVREGLIGLVQFLGGIALITGAVLLGFWIFITFGTVPIIVVGCVTVVAIIFVISATT